MDGTLIDSMPQHAEAFSGILAAEYAIPVDFSKEVYMKTAGKPLDEQFAFAIELKTGVHVQSTDALLDQFWSLIQESDPVLFPDVGHVLHALHQAGFTMVVISGCSPEVVRAKIRRAGIESLFLFTLGTDRSIPGMVKGQGHLEIIRNKLQVTPACFQADSVLIGDAPHDMMIARNANITAVARVSRGNADDLRAAGADFLINDLSELVPILRAIGSIQIGC